MKRDTYLIVMLCIAICLTTTTTSQVRDSARLKKSTGLILGASVVSFGILFAMPSSVTNWNKADASIATAGKDWWNNVSQGPVWDRDRFSMNWVMHPYCGGIYYMTARSAGYQWYESFGYAVLMSTVFWEYGVEAFAEIPSCQDLVITPVLGSMVGEGFYELKKHINANGGELCGKRWLGQTTKLLIDPLNEIQDRMMNNKNKKSQLAMHSWIGTVSAGNIQTCGLNIKVTF